MIWSGLLIYWANAVYGVKIFGYELFHFFPAWFSETAYSVAGDRTVEGKGWLMKLEAVDKNKRFCSQGKLLDE